MHSYCSQLVGEVTSGKQMALLVVQGFMFAVPVSDTDEVALRESAVPRNTKTTTERGIRVWSE